MIKIDKIFRDKRAMPVIYILLAVGILMLVCANSPMRDFSYRTDTKKMQVDFTIIKIKIQTSLQDCQIQRHRPRIPKVQGSFQHP